MGDRTVRTASLLFLLSAALLAVGAADSETPKPLLTPQRSEPVMVAETSGPADVTDEHRTREYAVLPGEGYRGVPWGSTVAEFRKLKGFRGKIGPQKSVTFFGNTVQADDPIRLILGVPTRMQLGYTSLRKDLIPREFDDVFLEKEDVHYVFFRDRLVSTVASIGRGSDSVVREELEGKYRKLGEETYQIAYASDYSMFISATSYSTSFGSSDSIDSGAAVVRVYLVFCSEYLSALCQATTISPG